MLDSAIVIGYPNTSVCSSLDIGNAFLGDFLCEVYELLCLAIKHIYVSILEEYPDRITFFVVIQSHDTIIINVRIVVFKDCAFCACDLGEPRFCGGPDETLSIDNHVIYESIG